ncbi:tRNA (adenosine(37)-N6)-threonylcarbamoyltransferase complex transferase subunit TsaD [Marivibrio halodurans]|uniref:tRNA N6-adenosine threonylcarbamoyltransferase n=1 Tax=Marivibrio halodurans TaxID=2039722 RepID=A0A8J7S4L6_9PROT|nr:tRNA (adenosine(37)-N6)-threonylcarbamoyltransferase complex transferase subunit TsaD [Marivibrio halodurans]MBP5858689.1 tRNA (adenosine(37)-N6)-threonylcarbamoyltransferase complex transferase subunit TsaD [Marivibrio halodurans]
MRILGIETSCDETAAAIVERDANGRGLIRANVVLSQLDEHRAYGGVVPEIAARSHLDHLDRLIAQALEEAGSGFDDLDGIAATAGPGLIGGVMVGALTAKAIAWARGLPFIAVNHLEGHALTARLTADDPAEAAFPYLLLLVSGGHCQLLAVEGVGRYRVLGTTVDDAVGEAFDKTAKLLDLGYPGGPAVERAAERSARRRAEAGEETPRFRLPIPMRGRDDCAFSFSGLKTAVRQQLERLDTPPGEAEREDLAAAFQTNAARSIADRTARACARFTAEVAPGRPLVVAGGVAANKVIRAELARVADAAGMTFLAPPLKLCTDNAAMIAWAGAERLALGLTDGLDFRPRPRWPLADLADRAPPGAGAAAQAEAGA